MADTDPNLSATIYANNQAFTAWESVTVQRAYGTGVAQFQFAAAEAVYGPGAVSLQIAPGIPVQIYLAGQKVIDGYCTERAGAYDAKSHSIVIAGDSRTIDIVNSAVEIQPGTYNGSTFEQAAQAVLAPHNISLTMANPPDGASQPFTSLVPQPGEKVAEFISRIAAARNLFITDDVNGNLVAGQANPNATISAALVEGQNILRASFKLNDISASASYRFQGVSQTAGSDDSWPTRAYSATATQPAARPNTYNYFIAEHPSNTQELVTAVTHEAIRSLWPVIEIEVTVVGWLRPSDGQLWATAPDDSGLVSIFSPTIFPNATNTAILGIQAVRFEQNSQDGTTTTLTLRTQNALSSTGAAGTGDSTVQPTVSPDAPDWQVGA